MDVGEFVFISWFVQVKSAIFAQNAPKIWTSARKRFIFIPGNHKSEHWLLIAIYPKCKVIALFDTINITSQTVQEIVKYILILLEIYSRFHGLNCELNKWKYVHEFDIPKQLSDIDCAVYISTYTAAIISMCSVSVKNVLLERFTIANQV